MKKFFVIINTLSVVFVVIVNYLAANGEINGNTISSLSSKYYNLFTPAAYAFSIWGIIFLGLIVNVIYQIRCLVSKKNTEFI